MTVLKRQVRHAALALGLSLAPQLASAQGGQGAPIVVRSPLYEGECVLSLEFTPPVPADLPATGVEVQVNERSLDLTHAAWPKPPEFDGRLLTIGLADGYRERDKVRARLKPSGPWSTTVEVLRSPRDISCKQPSERGSHDDRPRLSSVVRIGASSETFAPEIERLQAGFKAKRSGSESTDGGTPSRESSISHLQLLSEFSLDYRATPKDRRALWILARSRYGAQQTTVCTTPGTVTPGGTPGSTPAPQSSEAVCKPEGTEAFSPSQAFKNVQNARVAEFTLGARYEFVALDGDGSPVSVYAAYTHGSLFVIDLDDKAVHDDFAGVGFVVTKGPLRDTYIESGTGVSEIFSPDQAKLNRWKTNAMLVTDGSVLKMWNPIRFFVLFSMDRAHGPDSFRTSYGGIVDLSRVFGGLGF